MGEHKSLSVGDISRLIELITEVSDRGECSPSEAIDNISRVVLPHTSTTECRRAALATFVAQLRKLRTRRNALVGAPLFRDPAWDMVLELFVANERGEELTITSLCYAAEVPLSTGTRQFQRLEEYGLATRKGDCEDTRRFIAKPTAKAIASVTTIAAMIFDVCESVGALSGASETRETNFPSLAEARARARASG